jgi:hypothetical protein
VAVSGDIAIAGASQVFRGGTGAVYIFERNEGGTDNWGEVKKVTASDASAGHNFGSSVAVSGDTAVVGAFVDGTGGSQAGAAYVFERNEGGPDNWGEVKKLIASDAQAGDRFGISVANSGDAAIAGAFFEDAGGSDAGAAYVFERKDADGDTDGDGIPNGTDLDDDNDGCTDEQELGSNPVFGGRRNPHNFWDFFDPDRDGAVAFGDFLLFVQHFGTNDEGGSALVNRNSDPLTTPDPGLGNYHPLFDRGAVVGTNPWNAGPPDGAIAFGDFLALVSQFGHSCA